MAKDTPAAGFSRRSLLRGGLASVALVTLGGVGLALQPGKPRRLPPGGLKVLSPAEYATLAAFADRSCPPRGPGVPSAADLDIAATADALFANAEEDVKKGLKMGLSIVESGLAGALFLERVRPFTQLSPAEQDRVLWHMRESKVTVRRTLFRALIGLTTSIYYGDPRVWSSVGYPGPPDPIAFRAAYADNLVDWNALRPAGGQGGG